MDRYNRNILIEGLGESGQQKLKSARILVVGAGGLGSPVLYYLAAAGVGTIGIIDYDVVDMTNLQRQILHFTQDIGMPKVVSAMEKLDALNPEVQIHTYRERLTEKNAEIIIRDYDFIVSCSDNYEAKFLVNDTCVRLGKPYSHGAALSLRGEAMTYIPGNACYRCVFGEMPKEGDLPTSAQVGILGSVAGIVGSIQATETIKYITGIGEQLLNRILIVDAKTMGFHSLKVEKSTECRCK